MTQSDDDLDQRVDQLLKAVGGRFTTARTAANVGPVPLADAAGISRNSLRELEAGGNVKLRTLLRAALALDLNPADLFEHRPDKVAEVTAALAGLLTSLPPDVRQAAEELAAELADGSDH